MNPLTKIAFVAIVGLPLLFSLDPVSAGTALALETIALVCMGAAGLIGRLHRRITLIVIVVAAGMLTSGVATLLYGKPGGEVWFAAGPAHITDNSAWLALATMLRVGALALPAVILFATTDVTELADALTQIARLPDRFVFGAIAGLRMLELARTDLTQVRRARRARGLPTGGMRTLMPLFVLSLRRAETLALAMEARGFDAPRSAPRSHYRESRTSWRDTLGILVAVAIAATAVIAALTTGAWHFVLS